MRPVTSHLPAAFVVFLLIASVLLPSADLASAAPASNWDSVARAAAGSAMAQAGMAFDCSSVSEIPLSECRALVSLYNNAGGQEWTNRSGWLENNIPCGWYGVSCFTGHVQNLSLNHNNLKGTIPPEIGDLTYLYGLALSQNRLTGFIPSDLGRLWVLLNLYLDNNKLSGSIPAELGSLHNLEILHLYSNQLSGSIPPQLGNLSHLEELRLHDNPLTGSLPSEFGNLTNVQEIYLYTTQLSGPLPLSLSNLHKLTRFHYAMTGLCEPRDPAFQTWLSNTPHSPGPFCGSDDLGFLPQPQGYSFANWDEAWGQYPLPPAIDDFTTADMRQMFGDEAVCQIIGGVCLVWWSAIEWNVAVNQIMSQAGHCLGIAATSLRFYKNQGYSPADYQSGAATPYDLALGSARRNISYYQAEQWTDPMRGYIDQALRTDPIVALRQLQQAAAGAIEPVVLVMLKESPSGTVGHAVTPYAVDERGLGEYWVRVYDSNFPADADLHLVFRMTDATWHYERDDGYKGTYSSHTLGLLPLSRFAEKPAGWVPQTAAPWSANVAGTSQIWLLGDGHLLIGDGQGHHVGYDAQKFVNDWPGASASVAFGGLAKATEPVYTVPMSATADILLDGRQATGTGTASISQFGTGYAASASELQISPSSRDRIFIAPDGSQIVYSANSAKSVTLTLAVNDVKAGGRFQVKGADLGSDQQVSLGLNIEKQELVLTNTRAGAGSYALDVRLVKAAEERRFFRNSVSVNAGDIDYFDYGAWDGSGALTLRIDHGGDGTIDETAKLSNQSNQVYLPTIVTS